MNTNMRTLGGRERIEEEGCAFQGVKRGDSAKLEEGIHAYQAAPMQIEFILNVTP
jgi:hypothetical protein